MEIFPKLEIVSFAINILSVLFVGVHSRIAYEKLIAKIELFNNFLFFAFVSTDTILFFTVLPYTCVRYYIFNMAEDSYFLFCPSWFVFFRKIKFSSKSTKKIDIIVKFSFSRYPFDWKTPFGYLLAWLAQCATAPTLGSIYIQFPNLLIGSCWLFIFIAEDVTQDVTAFNVIVKATTANKNRVELTKRFSAMVQIYLDANQYAQEFELFWMNLVWRCNYLSDVLWNSTKSSSILCLRFLFGTCSAHH